MTQRDIFLSFERKLLLRLKGRGDLVQEVSYQRSPPVVGKVCAWHFAPTDPKKIKGGVVLAHGLGNDLFYPQTLLIEHLVVSGYEVLCFDLDGHGRRSTTVLRDRAQLDGCIADAIKTAKSIFTSSTIHLCGFSLGASVSLNAYCAMAKLPNSGLQGLVLIGMPANLKFSPWQVALGEAQCLLHPSFRHAMASYGWYDVWPSVGQFKRSRYPIRIDPEETSDFRSPLDLVEHSFTISRSKLNAQDPTTGANIMGIYGSADAIAISGYEMLRDLGISTRIFTRENHTSLMFSKPAFDEIVAWLDTPERRDQSP